MIAFQAVSQEEQSLEGTAVLLKRDTLYYIYSGMGPYSEEERVRIIEARLASLLQLDDFEPDSLHIQPADESYALQYKAKTLVTVT